MFTDHSDANRSVRQAWAARQCLGTHSHWLHMTLIDCNPSEGVDDGVKAVYAWAPGALGWVCLERKDDVFKGGKTSRRKEPHPLPQHNKLPQRPTQNIHSLAQNEVPLHRHCSAARSRLSPYHCPARSSQWPGLWSRRRYPRCAIQQPHHQRKRCQPCLQCEPLLLQPGD